MRFGAVSALLASLVFASVLPFKRSWSGAGNEKELLIYVSALEGSDSWSGLLPAPNLASTDGPLASFEGARAKICSIDKTELSRIVVRFRDGSQAPATTQASRLNRSTLVEDAAFHFGEGASDLALRADFGGQKTFRDGVYRLTSTITLSAADSGSPQTEIVYQSYPGEHPVFSGGVRITKWVDLGGNKWQATLPQGMQNFENLFYNGERRLRPRLGGYLGPYNRIYDEVNHLGSGDPTWINANCATYPTTSRCFDRFKYITSTADPAQQPMVLNPDPSSWGNLYFATNTLCGNGTLNQDPNLLGDIEALVFEQFSTSKLRVNCVDFAKHIVYMTGPTPVPGADHESEPGFIQSHRIIFENVQGALSAPGQWFLNHPSTGAWTLTYLARFGENPNFDEVIVPQVAQLFVGQNVQHVTLRGLTFEHDNYVIPFQGHASSELEADISSAVSFQNSNHITVDRVVVRHTAGGGLDFDTCSADVDANGNSISPKWCTARAPSPTSTYSSIQNSIFYDLGAHGIRIGENAVGPLAQFFDDNTSAHDFLVQNNLVQGYGRVIPAAFGIGQGVGYNNNYAHNEVFDGYHTAISISHGGDDNVLAKGRGNADNTIEYNRVYDLLQGIMSDGGSLRIEAGNNKGTSTGNKIWHNVVHDTSDSSIIDNPSTVPNLQKSGYGGDGIYLDNSTGDVDVEFNLVYRVSDTAVYTPHGPPTNGYPIKVKNNILAYARKAMIGVNDPYQTQNQNVNQTGLSWIPTFVFQVSNNIFYFDRDSTFTPSFAIENNCIFPGDTNTPPPLHLLPFPAYESFSNNLYWSTIYGSGFKTGGGGFAVLSLQVASLIAGDPCGPKTTPDYYSLEQWMKQFGEDAGSVARDPGFAKPYYPFDDYSLRLGSPLAGFIPFDPDEAGRFPEFFRPPPVAPTFVTMPYDPKTDF